ncbi:MAG: WG repeat-containing protein [Prevotellaceae bacterium]|jgi:hypothetical protein|nr:WG repeat-containing protein [Prevotellaceae bacterium]
MRRVKIFGLIAFAMLSCIACNNSAKSKKLNSKTAVYDSIEESKETAILSEIYDSIEITNDWYAIGNDSKQLKLAIKNGKKGFIYENGEELFPCVFDSIVNVQGGNPNNENNSYFTYSYDNNHYAKVKKDGKWGIVTIDGKVVVSYMYDDIYDFDYTQTSRMEGPYIDFLDYEGKTAMVKKDGKWGIVNTKGEVLAACVYEAFFIPDVHLFCADRAAAKKDGLWGFLNEKGKPVTAFIYEDVGSMDLKIPQFTSTFCGGMAIVKKTGKWGAIDTDGNEKVPFIYDYISNFSSEATIAQKDGKWGYINKNGVEVIPVIYDEIKWFENGLCPAKTNGLWGFLNEKGETVVPAMYDDILVSDEISVDGGLWFFSQDDYCAVKRDGKWGLIDKDNNIVIGFEYDGVKFTSDGLEDWRYFSDGFISVQKGKFWSVVNKDGLNHIPFEYDDVEIWSKGNVCVKRNDKWGLLDSLGMLLVPLEHKYAMDACNYLSKANK